MSPEQAAGLALDARSDLFACGIVLYEMLFGRRLFAGRSDLETLDNVRKAEVPWPEEITKDLLPGLVEVLRRSLQVRPEDRFPDAEAWSVACVPPEPASVAAHCRLFVGEAFVGRFELVRQHIGGPSDGRFLRRTGIREGKRRFLWSETPAVLN
jgi:serine/threonine-protein kinase